MMMNFYQPNNFLPEKDTLTETQANTIHDKQDDVTVLSWLEHMQARHPMLIDDEPMNNKETVNPR